MHFHYSKLVFVNKDKDQSLSVEINSIVLCKSAFLMKKTEAGKVPATTLV